MFEGCVSDSINKHIQKLLPFGSNPLDEDEDVAIKNIIGTGDAVDLALRWADSGSIRRKLEVAREYLKPPERIIVNRVLGVSAASRSSPPPIMDRGKGKAVKELPWSDEDTDDDDDEPGRTAHRLFASLAGIDEKETSWWSSSPASEKADACGSQSISAANQSGLSKAFSPLKQQPPNFHPLTPVSSPSRPNERTPINRIHQLATPTPTHRSHRFVKKQGLKARNGLGSPIVLQSSSPFHTIFSSPVSKSKSKVPERYALKSPLTEQKNRVSASTDSPLTFSMPMSGPSDSPVQHHQSGTCILHAVVSQMSPQPGHSSGYQGVGPKSPEPKLLLHDFSPPSRPPSHSHSPSQKRYRRARSCLQRIKIGERLAQLRPGAVAPSYASKRARLLAKHARLEAKTSHARAVAELGTEKAFGLLRSEPTITSFDVIEDDDGGMDWNRSRDLADAVRAAIANGQPISLPPLKCADSQSSQYAFQ